MHIGQTCEFGGAPNFVEQPQKSFVAVASSECISSPITGSYVIISIKDSYEFEIFNYCHFTPRNPLRNSFEFPGPKSLKLLLQFRGAKDFRDSVPEITSPRGI
jgi:hypothetical protein